ncbi:2-oxoisovalerate dehydrogenase E1 component [Catalinimonas alkaloidigena]|uniref:alpha-ketoacid dehydrogenase subunit alpha/beta n=1 Tax=Catalinimonas alkaloidigena TaxID=1075417 RepID=UPI00240679D8|nr:alpha-ketoacid dehydrogenase subunit alpha/beta [Catalinimonas alkaloidigena]MDF9799455.1 2-oxoisovalerate dehydrogenase E1 component [Catalinimonas alkaloidigena]
MESTKTYQEDITHKLSVEEILTDYRIAWESRHASIIGRKEVFMGKAKFGVFGDGKEVAQIAMAKAFRKGDFRSGYYRDQTFMFALGEITIQQFFAQLYAHATLEADPSSGGRMMNAHFGSRMVDMQSGKFHSQTDTYNSSSDISPTAGQIPRAVGFAYASKLYRENPALQGEAYEAFSHHGDEVTFATIGDAATSEGMFLETINAAGVLQIPLILSVWDDDFGISVPKEYHTTKLSISEALSGFQRTENEPGLEIFRVKGWDYEKLCEAYRIAANIARSEHVPVLMHVEDLTQPQGHSTSGSHERYKTKERLAWEKEYDCNLKMREWILQNGFSTDEELDAIERQASETAKKAKNEAWKAYRSELDTELKQLSGLVLNVAEKSPQKEKVKEIHHELKKTLGPIRLDGVKAAKKTLRLTAGESSDERQALLKWLKKSESDNYDRFNAHLYSETASSALKVEEVKPVFDENNSPVDGREVLQACFDHILKRDPRVFAIGEDVGKIGDVNQGFAGLQEKHGEIRVTDTGIRETTIIGQGIGSAIRGLRPITEIQYLDYIFYALATLTDDLASLRYRTRGGQSAPLIIRTRGHRLEGIWHSGSPIGSILHSLRGIYLLVPRNMVQAAGFYNTMLLSDDPCIIIECLNGYRLKERVPTNLDEFTVPLGQPEIIREGNDITIVTYGSMCRVVMQASEQLEQFGISCEVIDVQTLLPFDINHTILESVKKTNRVIFADEDVPGGASAYMMQQVLEEQGAYHFLDSAPKTISSAPNRPAYGSDGDYFSKPNQEDIFDTAYALMFEFDPERYKDLYK